MADLAHPVHRVMLAKGAPNVIQARRIALCPCRPARRVGLLLAMAETARRCDLHHVADRLDTVVRVMRVDECVHHRVGYFV